MSSHKANDNGLWTALLCSKQPQPVHHPFARAADDQRQTGPWALEQH